MSDEHGWRYFHFPLVKAALLSNIIHAAERGEKLMLSDLAILDKIAEELRTQPAAPSPPVSVEQAGIMGATGWAIATDGVIDVTTVSPMRRAAIINWLVTNRGQLIFNHHTDEQIESWWAALRGASEAVVVIVNAALAAVSPVQETKEEAR